MYYSPLGIPADNLKIIEIGDLVRCVFPNKLPHSPDIHFGDIRKVINIYGSSGIVIKGLKGSWNNPNYRSGTWEVLNVVQHIKETPIAQKFMAIIDNTIKPLSLKEIPIGSYIINNYSVPKLFLTSGISITDLDNIADAIFNKNVSYLSILNQRITDLYEITEKVLQMIDMRNNPIILTQ